MKTIRLILTFYRNFFLLSLIVTLVCMFSIYINGIRAFFAIFICKTLILATIVYFINIYKEKEFYYYRNLGISKLTLWVTTISLDYFLFIILLTLTYKYK